MDQSNNMEAYMGEVCLVLKERWSFPSLYALLLSAFLLNFLPGFDTQAKAQSSVFDGAGTTLLDEGIMVATSGAINSFFTASYTLRLHDVRTIGYSSPGISTSIPNYTHPDWIAQEIGNVDGLTIDKHLNIYVAATSSAANYLGNSAWRYGQIGGGADNLNAAGTIYKVDAATGIPTVFCSLPQQSTLMLADLIRITGPGLGGLDYDKKHNQFFVSNLEDGRIYRIDSVGNVVQFFDPLLPDNGSAGFAPSGELIRAVAVYDNRIFYSISNYGNLGMNNSIEIRSVGLSATGEILEYTDEAVLAENWSSFEPLIFNGLYDTEVIDIEFSPSGKMAVGTKSYGLGSPYACKLGASCNAVYELIAGDWIRTKAYATGSPPLVLLPSARATSYGGLAWGPYQSGADTEEILWSTAGDLYGNQHGVIGINFDQLPNNLATGSGGLDYIAFEFIPGSADLHGLGGNVEVVQREKLNVSAAVSDICVLPTGTIDLTVTGGLPPYNFTWSTGDTTPDLNGLPAGTYHLTLSDAFETLDFSYTVEDDCNTDVDCSSTSSAFYDSTGSKLLARGIMAITCGTTTDMPDSLRYTMAIVDTRLSAYDTALQFPIAYHHEDWIVSKIGNVDGIEIDGLGNIYVTASSYLSSFVSFDWRYGEIGGGPDDLGAAGTIYKIDAFTGQPSVFAQLPQQETDLIGYATFLSAARPGLTSRLSGPGLGNITHEISTGSFYVSNLEDGKIYHLSMNGTVLGSFDPQLPDNGAAGFPPESEVVYGLDVYNGRLYYLMRSPNPQQVTVRSVALGVDGDFLPASDQLEINDIWVDADVALYELEPHDIAFAEDGHMAIGTRTFANSLIEMYSHSSYNAVYTFVAGGWVRDRAFGPGSATGGSVAGSGEAYGGIAWGPYQQSLSNYELLWSSSGDILDDEHGIIGIEFNDLPNDFDAGNDSLDYVGFEYMPGAGDLKGIGGDVEIWIDIVENCKVTAENDTFYVESLAVLMETVASNDSDLSGYSLDYLTEGCGPYNGTLTFDDAGSFTYVPTAGFIGVDSFCYVACNPLLVCDEARVIINVTGPNPTAVDDLASTQEDLFLLVDLISNDIGTALDPASVVLTNLPSPAVATVVNNFDGSVLINPSADYFGNFDFNYSIADVGGGLDTALVSISVLPLPDPPTAVDDAYSSADSLPIFLDPIGNDFDVDGDLDPSSLNVLSGVPPSQGSIVPIGSGAVFFPVLGYCGPVDPIHYQISDLAGAVDTGVIFITLGCYNLPPYAKLDSSAVCFGEAITVDVLDNDFDIDGTLDLTTLSVTTTPVHGNTVVNADGSIKYIHLGYTGVVDSFTYRIYDDAGSLAEAKVMIDIKEQLLASAILTVPTCGASNGAIDLQIYSGASPFTYSWSTGDSTEDLSALASGVYSVFVLDSEGCSHGLSINLEEAPDVKIESVTPIDASGCNSLDGGIIVDIVDATALYPPYHLKVNGTFTLGPFYDDPISVTGAAGGVTIYNVQLIDSVGCVDVKSGPIPIGRPNNPEIESIDLDGAICGDTEATILINLDDVEIGSPPYLLALLPGPVTIGPIPGGVDTLAFTVPYGSYNRFKLFDSNACQDRYNAPFELVAPCGECRHPNNLNTVVNGGFTATLQWSSIDEALAYEARIRPVGTAPWFAVPPTLDTTRLVGSMMPLSTYEWQVRSLCDSTHVSDWSPVATFTTLAAKLESSTNFSTYLYPNPAQQVTTLYIESSAEHGALEIYLVNSTGQLVYRSNRSVPAGKTDLPLAIPDLAPGVYEVVIRSADGVVLSRERLIVQQP